MGCRFFWNSDADYKFWHEHSHTKITRLSMNIDESSENKINENANTPIIVDNIEENEIVLLHWTIDDIEMVLNEPDYPPVYFNRVTGENYYDEAWRALVN